MRIIAEELSVPKGLTFVCGARENGRYDIQSRLAEGDWYDRVILVNTIAHGLSLEELGKLAWVICRTLHEATQEGAS